MRLYIASKYENQAEVRALMDLLARRGHTITHDWTTVTEPAGLGPWERRQFLGACAEKDFKGVAQADALIIINHPEGKGMLVEMGVALGLGIPVYLLYPDRATNVFNNLGAVAEYVAMDELAADLGDAR